MSIIINTPFFMLSPKTYLIGKELLDLAKLSDEYAAKTNSTIFFSAPPTELVNIVNNTKNMVITAQSSDGFNLGRGMGRTTLKSLKSIGVRATFLNHMENQLTLKELSIGIKEAKKLDIISIACADSVEEARALAILKPDIILCEQHDLIGTGITSDENYIKSTIEAIKEIDNSILVMEGAGIRNGADVSRLISLGADGTGISSGLALSMNKEDLLKDLFIGLDV